MDRKLLWGRAGNRCAWPECLQRLTVDLNTPESHLLAAHGAVIGEEAHIRSPRATGPRHDPEYPTDKLDTYENLILLCPTHHAVIDKDHGSGWPTERVVELKLVHENAIDGALGTDERALRELDELLAARLLVWESMAGLSRWRDITAGLNSVHPSVSDADWTALFQLSAWLLERRWPPQYPKISTAFENHRRALTVLLSKLSTVVEHDRGGYQIERPHTRIDWNPSLYTELLSKLNVDSHIISLLTLELTRSVNLVIAAIAEELDPLYRFAEGYVLMSDGDPILGWSLTRVEYEQPDWREFPIDYSLASIEERMYEALQGGDPRTEPAVDLYEVDVRQWSAGAETQGPSQGGAQES